MTKTGSKILFLSLGMAGVLGACGDDGGSGGTDARTDTRPGDAGPDRTPDMGVDMAVDMNVAETPTTPDVQPADTMIEAPIPPPPPEAPVIWALTVANHLVSFRADAPSTMISDIAVTGLQASENLVGITLRPTTGELFGVGSTSRIYKIAPSGAATAVGTMPFAPTLAGANFGVDFNPVVDRIRLVSDQEQNLRLNQLTGAVAATDPNINPAGEVVAVAYTNDQLYPTAATKTTLYVIDSASDKLGRQGGVDGTPSPNLGAITEIGALGVDTDTRVGFDIFPGSNVAYASLTVAGVSKLHTINLTTGAATLVGNVAGGAVVRAIAIDSGEGSALYQRIGRAAGVRTVIGDFLGRVLKDSKINGFFLNSTLNAGRLSECLVLQVGSLTGGPEKYNCRSMKESHMGLKISQRDFDDLAGHLAAAITAAGVADADKDTIMGAAGMLTGDIVEDAPNTGTVYQRVGRKPAIQTVIDMFITKVAMDVRINGFFTGVVADPNKTARLKTCLVRQVCSIDGPCKYGKEVDPVVIDATTSTDPGVTTATPCLDMMSSHMGLTKPPGGAPGLPITKADFDALIEDLSMVLDGTTVTTADKNAILMTLRSMCSQIVAGGTGC